MRRKKKETRNKYNAKCLAIQQYLDTTGTDKRYTGQVFLYNALGGRHCAIPKATYWDCETASCGYVHKVIQWAQDDRERYGR